MRTALVVLAVGLSLAVPAANAESGADSSTELVQAGIAAYRDEGAAAAIRAWVKGGALEGDTNVLSQANMLRQIEDFYGAVKDGDIVREVTISARSRIVYFAINYDNGVSFARLQTYRRHDGGWVATSFFIHTEAAQVFPASMLH
ncbi:MAG TPA: hypothetical protein PK725_17840 [Rhodocyclaceae bacterium]|nr:hypothetical protein [Rhodocyclaceae bacterium]